MLSNRSGIILRTIVGHYITNAAPVPSHAILDFSELGVSPATVRNEMVRLEQEGYIMRPHHSAGSVPLDKGYRHYVESLENVSFPVDEQRLVSHLFHQVELELETWLELAAALTAQKALNAALITMPRAGACQLKRLELVSLHDSLALVVLILRGARVKQQLVTFEQPISQDDLSKISRRLTDVYSGSNVVGIKKSETLLSTVENVISDCVLKLMEAEDRLGQESSFVDGLHLTLNQPEFTRDHWLAQTLMELIEQRSVLREVVNADKDKDKNKIRVVIGRENQSQAMRDYSIVISRYGLPNEAEGMICVIGPTRMPYGRTIATVDYISQMLNGLISRLYGEKQNEDAEKV